MKRKLPDGQETTWAYSGNTTTESVTGGTWTKYTTDGFGRMKMVQRGYAAVAESQVDYEYTRRAAAVRSGNCGATRSRTVRRFRRSACGLRTRTTSWDV